MERALVQVARHPQHHLLPITRYDLYKQLRRDDDARGRRARGHLAIAAAQRVLPIWTGDRPTDYVPQHALYVARKVAGEMVDVGEASTTAQAAWTHLEQVAESHGEDTHRGLVAGMSAVRALLEATGDDPFDGVSLDEETTDADLDPWSTDAAAFAVGAWAGAAWEPNSDPGKRGEFWEWWLSAAVREAWEAADLG